MSAKLIFNLRGKTLDILRSHNSAESAEDQARQSHALLLKPDERLRLIEENVQDYAIIVIAADGKIVNWNIGAERIIGWTEAEAVEQDTGLIFTPEDRQQGVPAQELERAKADGRTVDERWHLRKDGSRFWGSGIMTALYEQDGNLRGFTKILRNRTEARQAQEELEAAHQRERRTAEVLQRSILLGSPIIHSPDLAISAQYVPAVDDLLVGGDFFDAFHLADNRIALIVGDVAGKGLGAAAQTAQIKFALRVLLREYPYPGIALHRLNSFLLESERLDAEEDIPTSCIVVLSLVIIDLVSGDIMVSTAGTEPPLIIRATGVLEQVATRNLPVGAMPDAEYLIQKSRLEPGDILLLVTDGITEARRGGEFLGYEGMVALAVKSCVHGSLEEMSKAIVEGARAFGGGFSDDVCLLLARRP